jgi:phosphatidylinositol alpha 1,6-mannosyltransferase
MSNAPRVAFFPDSFHEVNGVAHTARNFQAYAQRHGLPFLCVRAALPGVRGGPVLATEGSITTLELPRSRAAIRMEKDLSFDPLFARHGPAIERALRAFKPDVIHMTGPSELGIFAAYFAWKLGIPLAASWHTNVHEYAARRAAWLSRVVPLAGRWIEAGALTATAQFYRLAKVLYAPNEELCDLLREKTGRPCNVMRRGVDTELFTPSRRTRASDDNTIVLGYVGRLSVEKNVALLPLVEQALQSAGISNACFLIVGHGDEEAMLRASLSQAHFMGVQRGEALAQSYADMDLFVFPSETDTFGNVVLEALASGVPAAVTTGGGPKFIVRDGITGVVRSAALLAEAICTVVKDQAHLRAMGQAARAYALTCSWDAIFDDVYAGYSGLNAG